MSPAASDQQPASSGACIAVYWRHGVLVEEPHLTPDAAAARLWDLFCAGDGSPVAVKDLNGATVMGAAELREDRLRRSETTLRE